MRPTTSFKILATAAVAGLSLLFSNRSTAQVTVDETYSVEQLVNDVLLGEGLSAFNITYNGVPADQLLNLQCAAFQIDSSAFPIQQGMVMATARASVINGQYGFLGESFQNDPDLIAISGVPMNNCAIVEFDFTAVTDTFLIDYIFASQEYPNFTCSQFNDVFGIFLSGPGIDGPFTNDAVNIATIPNTDTPVGINTINSGTSSGFYENGTCIEANPNFVEDAIYFMDNDPNLSNSISLPGHTHLLTAFAQLVAGETYHFKLAIGNANDQGFQSAVMMRKGSANSVSTSNLVDIYVNTEGVEVAPEGMFVAGTFNYFVPEPMDQVSLNLYKYAAAVAPSVNVTYKFFNGNGADAAEVVPTACGINGAMSGGNRHFVMPEQSVTLETVCFASCEVCNVLGTEEGSDDQHLHLFPNPTRGQFQVLAPANGEVRVEIYDVAGRKIHAENTNAVQGNVLQFQLPAYAKGLYQVILQYGQQVETRYSAKLMVE